MSQTETRLLGPPPATAPLFCLGYLSDRLLQRVPDSSLTSTNTQRAGLPQTSRAWAQAPVLLPLSPSLPRREPLGNAPSRLYLEKGGAGNAASSNFIQRLRTACPHPPPGQHHGAGDGLPPPGRRLKSSPASAQP